MSCEVKVKILFFSFSPFWTSSYSSTLYWQNYLFPIELSWYLCQKFNWLCIYVGLFLYPQSTLVSEAGSYISISDPRVGMQLGSPGSHMTPGLRDAQDPPGRRHTQGLFSTVKRKRERLPGHSAWLWSQQRGHWNLEISFSFSSEKWERLEKGKAKTEDGQ